jgi:hypothetical protein
MAGKLISNPSGAYGLSPDFADYVKPTYQNNPSGTTRTVGDVVIIVPPAANTTTYLPPQVDGTTTAADVKVIGVVGEPQATGPDSGAVGGQNQAGQGEGTSGKTFNAAAELPVVTDGIARINIGGGTITAGALLTTSGTTGVATASATPATGTVIAVALDTSTNAVTVGGVTTIRAIIKKM